MENGNGNLNRRAMLANLSISQWTARKYDRKVSKEVAEKYNATQDAGRYNKVLIAQEEIKVISKVANAARTFHYFQTLPWNDNGDRILPAKNFERYQEGIEKFKRDFDDAVTRFIALYPALKDDARRNLNGLFNEEDYPATEHLRGKYSFRPTFEPLALAADFRVDLIGAQAADAIRQDLETRTQDAQQKATAELYQRLYDSVKHMADKLADPEGIFRDSLVNNLVELCGVLPSLNFADDPELAALTDEVRDKLTNLDPQTLRTSVMFRGQTASDAGEILAKITGTAGRYIDLS